MSGSDKPDAEAVTNRSAVAGYGDAVGLIIDWVATHPPGEALVLTTAPTQERVVTGLWDELRGVSEVYSLPGSVTKDAKWIIDGRIVAFGRGANARNPDAFRGIHARYLMVVIDGPTEIPWNVLELIDMLACSDDSHILEIK